MSYTEQVSTLTVNTESVLFWSAEMRPLWERWKACSYDSYRKHLQQWDTQNPNNFTRDCLKSLFCALGQSDAVSNMCSDNMSAKQFVSDVWASSKGVFRNQRSVRDGNPFTHFGVDLQLCQEPHLVNERHRQQLFCLMTPLAPQERPAYNRFIAG